MTDSYKEIKLNIPHSHEDYQEMEAQTVKFLEKIRGENGILEITDLTTVLGSIDDYESIIKEYTVEPIYFVGYLPKKEIVNELLAGKKLKRARDEFAAGTRYFRADFDIRKNTTDEDGAIITQGQLYDFIRILMHVLKTDEVLGTYNAVVCSGNGAHIYWMGEDTEMDAKTYSNGANYYLNRISKLLEENDLAFLKPDYACSNITRLLRLPCTSNFVYEYDEMVDRVNVDLLFFQDTISPVISTFPEVAKEFVKEQENKLKNSIKKTKKFEKNMIKKGLVKSGRYDAVNSLDIRDLVCQLTGRKLAKNGKNFISNKDGKYTGAFAIPEENVVVRSGTPHLSDYYTVYSPYSLLYAHCGNKNHRCTFEYIKEHYPDINPNEAKFYFGKGLEYNG